MPILFVAIFAMRAFALQHSCSALPALIVEGDYVIDGVAYRGEEPLRYTPVYLYSQNKLARRIVTDADARFLFEHLSHGSYTLNIQGLGSFNIKVVTTGVEPTRQRQYYSFVRTRDGCLSWGADTN